MRLMLPTEPLIVSFISSMKCEPDAEHLKLLEGPTAGTTDVLLELPENAYMWFWSSKIRGKSSTQMKNFGTRK